MIFLYHAKQQVLRNKYYINEPDYKPAFHKWCRPNM